MHVPFARMYVCFLSKEGFLYETLIVLHCQKYFKDAANWGLAATLNVPSFMFLCSHLQSPEIRIYVLNMYAQHARRVLCAVSYLTNRNLNMNMMT